MKGNTLLTTFENDDSYSLVKHVSNSKTNLSMNAWQYTFNYASNRWFNNPNFKDWFSAYVPNPFLIRALSNESLASVITSLTSTHVPTSL